ncbi:MAG: FAD-dependent oxidoreductase, partial [Candidatus Dormibacteria bacterium]
PNAAGRVLDGGEPMPGAYVTGWLKRGPTGVIGTNKEDATETVACLVEDLAGLPATDDRDPQDVLRVLRERGVDVVAWEDWERLDAEEVRLGEGRGCDRVKVAELDAMLAACRPTAVRV